MKVDVTNEMDSRILEGLTTLEKGEDEFSRLAGVYRELVQIQMDAKLRAKVNRPGLSEHLARERLREGVPLLLFEEFHPDWNQVQAVLNQVIDRATADSYVSGETNDALRALGSNPVLLREAAEAWYRGLPLTERSLGRHIDVELLTSVLGATLKPFLSAYAALLLPEIDQESWRRNICPVCGGKADFSALKEGGTRWLFCSRCDGEWLFSRMECPCCGTRDQEALAYFTRKEQPGLYRLYVCEECHTYIKGIDSRLSDADVLLPLERVRTLDLDREAQEKGYGPGWTTREFPAEEATERRGN
jgi:FdhE protein